MTTELDKPEKPLSFTLDIRKPLKSYDAGQWSEILEAQVHEWGKVVPAYVGKRFAAGLSRLALTTLKTDSKLLDCSTSSILLSLMHAAELGYEINTPRKHAYLVPFKGECMLMPGFQGLAQSAMRSGVVQYIETSIVYEGDEFSYERGLTPKLYHKPQIEEQPISAATHVYAIARMKGMPPELHKFEVLPRKYVERIKKSALKKAAKRYTCWGDPDMEPEMWKKTAVRYLCKLLPDDTLPDALMRVWEREDQMYTDEFQIEAATARSTEDMAAELDEVLDRSVPVEDEPAAERSPEFANVDDATLAAMIKGVTAEVEEVQSFGAAPDDAELVTVKAKRAALLAEQKARQG